MYMSAPGISGTRRENAEHQLLSHEGHHKRTLVEHRKWTTAVKRLNHSSIPAAIGGRPGRSDVRLSGENSPKNSDRQKLPGGFFRADSVAEGPAVESPDVARLKFAQARCQAELTPSGPQCCARNQKILNSSFVRNESSCRSSLAVSAPSSSARTGASRRL